MKAIAPIGVCVVAVSLVFDGQKHVEHASYHGAAQATQPLGTVLATATASAIAMLPGWDSSLKNIIL